MRSTELQRGGGVAAIDYTVVLADLHRKREELDAAIAVITRLAGQVTPNETMPPPAETKAVRRAPKRAARTTTPPKGDTVRPTDALLDAKIRAALKAGHVTPKALQAATTLKVGKLFKVLNAMLEAGTVTKTGQMRAVRYALA